MARTGFTLPRVFTEYLKYRFAARSKRGFGIHSPLIYDFSRKVLLNEMRMQVPNQVLLVHRALRSDPAVLEVEPFGAGSRVFSGSRRSVRSMVRSSSLPEKYGEMLFRLTGWYAPEHILELGTGLGVSTLYLAAGSRCELVTVEGSQTKSDFARKLLNKTGYAGVRVLCRQFSDHLASMDLPGVGRRMVYIDGDHGYESTRNMVNTLLDQRDSGEMLVVIDDIHWSADMQKAWRECAADPRTGHSVDIFRMGFLFSGENISKQHFIITF